MDEDSVKVEGTGSAIITDISVVSLPNRDIFNEVYPDDDVSDESDDEDEDPESSAELKQAEARVTEIRDEARLVEDSILSTSKRQQILDLRSESADKSELEKGARLTELLAAYKKEREALCEEGLKAAQAQRHIHEKMNAATSHLHKVQKAALKESRERRKAKEREREIKRMRRNERLEEKERIRKERESFWPKYCYSVTITLDVNTMTPISSRRQSIASDIDVVKVATNKDDGYDGDTFQEGFSCDLTLSYITSAAKWQPSYDLQLSTTSATATLCFDAKISNETSETWKNCKVSLSTSDAAFAGIDSALPELVPWRIRLGGKSSHYGGRDDQITRSRTECFEHQSYVRERMSRTVDHKSRFDMFGLPYGGHGGCFPPPPAVSIGAIPCVKPIPPGGAREVSDDNGDTVGGLQNWGGEAETKGRRRMTRKSADVDYRAVPQAAAAPPPPAAPRASMAMASAGPYAPAPLAGGSAGGGGGGYGGPGGGRGGFGSAAAAPYADPEAIDFEDSFIEEAGMTTNYDLPGLKTLAPKSTASKQRVARITFSNVNLSHSVIAKYRPVAYLQAKLKNGSKLTLLEGASGLTLDGSFMGRTKIPRCSPGDTFTLSLGVDPAIKVSYPKPDVRRATTGLFNKESSSVFARSILLHNTRAASGKPAQLHVQDQVPVSEDERLRVELVTPRGLHASEGSVVAGAPGREEDNRDKDWGKATALLKPGGEVNWDVRLNPGKMVKLWLEYAVSVPSGDVAVEC